MLSPIKQKHGLTTDVGTDYKSAVYGITGAIVILEKLTDSVTSMDAGWDKTLLIVLFCVTMMVINYLTVGHQPEKAEEVDESEVDDEEVPDLLNRGRK